MPLSIKHYRSSIGNYQNTINKTLPDNSKQQRYLHIMARSPGDPAKRARAELMLQLLIVVSNTLQNTINDSEKPNSKKNINNIKVSGKKHQTPWPAEGLGQSKTQRVLHRDRSDRTVDWVSAFASASHRTHEKETKMDASSRSTDGAEKHTGKRRHRRGAVTEASTVKPSSGVGPTVAATVIKTTPPVLPSEILAVDSSVDDFPTSLFRHNPTKHIIHFLSKKNVLGPGDDHGTYSLINASIDYINNIDRGLSKITAELLKGTGNYGAHKDEILSLDLQYHIFNRWLEARLFDGGLGEFIAREIQINHHDHAIADETPESRLSARLYKAIFSRIDARLSDGKQSVTGNRTLSGPAKDYILREIVPTVLPALRFYNETLPDDGIDPGQVEWGFLHAGLRFADSIGLDGEAITKEEAIQLGRSMLDMLKNGGLPPWHVHFFELPARLFHIRSASAAGEALSIDALFGTEKITQEALEAFFAENDKIIADNNPFARFLSALENYKTRPQLAGGGVVEEATDLFNKQNNEIADKFAIVDQLMVTHVIDAMPAEESAFLGGAAVSAISAEFSAFSAIKGQMTARYLPRRSYIIGLLPDVDLLSADNGGETRIFALRRTAGDYELMRVDRHRDRYYELMSDSIACRNPQEYQLKIYSHAVNAPVMKKNGQGNDVLATALMQKHKAALLTQLHAQGYMETSLEKIQSVFLSMFPFYDCHSDIREGRSQALISCTIDVLSLASVAGKGLGLAGRAAQKSLFGGTMAYRKTLGILAARASVRAALSTVAKNTLKGAAVSAMSELSDKALIQLGVSALRSLDPGLELMGCLSYGTIRQVAAIARAADNRLAIWKKFLPELERHLSRQAGEQTPVEYSHARLPGGAKDLPVVKLGGDTLRGKDIYVRVSPETGEVFGKKYTLSAENILTTVPLPLAMRLKNILQEGLSGRGAQRAARRLAARRSPYEQAGHPGQPYTIAMASHLLRWIENRMSSAPLSIETFIARQGLTGSRWRHYINKDGTLSASGHELLDVTGMTSWNRMFDLPPELQSEIIRYLDPPSLRGMIGAFPITDGSHPRSISLRAMANTRLTILRNEYFFGWTLWMRQGGQLESRVAALELLKTAFDSNAALLDLRGMKLSELPARLPGGLKELNVSGNRLAFLPDNLPGGLRKLDVSNNLLNHFPETLPGTLETILARHNRLERLPGCWPDSLTRLDVAYNHLLRLPDVLPVRLEILDIGFNMLSELPQGLPGTLKYVTIPMNRLRALPDSLPLFLSYLDASDNLLSRLPDRLPPRLSYLNVENNVLESLPDTLPDKLKQLKVTSNLLTELPPNLPEGMTHIYATNNVIFELPDTLPKKLRYLVAHKNMLLKLPSSLPDSLSSLGLNNNFLAVLENNLPDTLELLYVRGNTHLMMPSKFPSALKTLDVRGCDVPARPPQLPEHVEFLYLDEV